MEVISSKEPENFQEEPKNFILFIDAAHVMEMEVLHTFATFSAMVFVWALENEAFRANIFQCWKLRGFEECEYVDISSGELSWRAIEPSNQQHQQMQY